MIIHDRSRYPAWAASGGCMGGDSFGSWSPSSDSSSSGSSWSSSSDSSSSWSSSSSGDSGSSWSSSSSSDYGGWYESKPWTEEEKKAFWREFWSFLGYVVATISALAAFWAVLDDQMVTARERNSIIKLQIGVLVTGRKLQSELNQIALTADTSTKKGISDVLTETIRVLLQHDDYFMSAYLSVNTKRRIWDGRSLFKQLSLEERKKFDEETLVNLNNVKKHVKKSAETTGISSDFVVITLLVAVTGVLKLPTINRTVELKEALQKLGSIPYNETIAAHVLWTPQVENETLSEEELTKDYPHLKPLEDDLKI